MDLRVGNFNFISKYNRLRNRLYLIVIIIEKKISEVNRNRGFFKAITHL